MGEIAVELRAPLSGPRPPLPVAQPLKGLLCCAAVDSPGRGGQEAEEEAGSTGPRERQQRVTVSGRGGETGLSPIGRLLSSFSQGIGVGVGHSTCSRAPRTVIKIGTVIY